MSCTYVAFIIGMCMIELYFYDYDSLWWDLCLYEFVYGLNVLLDEICFLWIESNLKIKYDSNLNAKLKLNIQIIYSVSSFTLCLELMSDIALLPSCGASNRRYI